MMQSISKFFTREELRDLIITILAVALVFSFPDLKKTFFTSLIIVIFSFFVHEIGHKFMAKRLGCMATYKIWPAGILLSIVSIFLKAIGGFMIIAPGYVEIMPYQFGRWGIKVIRLTPRDMGQIALAGVGVNIFLAIFFSLFSGEIFQTLSYINAVLAIFNLLPIPPLDGARIFTWSIWFWVFLMLVTGIALIV
ncbi:MAG: hypothetical protein DRJ64_06840 [Thermoprotei archaeon]|nr:MAG: hypothetical protein DRJ64_06840 [Thermoprotei archaeon]